MVKMSLAKNRLQILVTLLFLGYVAWWVSFQHVVERQGLLVQWYGVTYGLMALIGSIIGFVAAQKWGGVKSTLGKAIMLFSLGLLAQEAGQLIYTYYVYGAKIQIPYPSWGDAAYFGSVLFYIAAASMLAKAAGVRFALRRPEYKLIAGLVPVALVGVSYAILLHNHKYDTSHPLTVFLDAGYPIGEAIYISIAVLAYLLSRKLLGGIMRAAMLVVLLAMVLQYVSDFTFVFQSNRGTYLAGRYDDLFYLTAYFVFTTAMIKFYATYASLRSKTAVPPGGASAVSEDGR